MARLLLKAYIAFIYNFMIRFEATNDNENIFFSILALLCLLNCIGGMLTSPSYSANITLIEDLIAWITFVLSLILLICTMITPLDKEQLIFVSISSLYSLIIPIISRKLIARRLFNEILNSTGHHIELKYESILFTLTQLLELLFHIDPKKSSSSRNKIIGLVESHRQKCNVHSCICT